MAWISADPVTNPTAGQELVGVEFTESGIVFVTVVVSTTLAFDAIFQRRNANLNTIGDAQILPVNQSLFASPRLGPINVRKGDRLRVVSRNAVVAETNASLFLEEARV